MNVAIIYALIAMFGFGIANIVMKHVVTSFGPVRAIVLRNVPNVLALGIALMITAPHIVLTPQFGWAILIAIAGYFPFLFFVHGLEKGKVGVIVPVAAGRIVVSALFSFMFLGEAFTGFKIAAVVVIFVGIVLASVNFKELKQSDLWSWQSGVPLALIAALTWGVVYPLFSFPSAMFGALFYAFVIELAVLACGIVHLRLDKKPLFPASSEERGLIRRNLAAIVIAGVATGVGTAFTNFGYLTGAISIVTAIGGASVIVSLVGAMLLFKERLTLQQYAGALSVVIGIAVAAFG